MSASPLDVVRSVKVKLGLLVAASVTVAAVVATFGAASGVPIWLSFPVTIALALALTQLLATGMTSPLRQMTTAASQMARGEYGVRVETDSRDEIGQLAVAFNQMARDLDQVDRQRRELIGNVSHELRTPLTALCAVLENLADGISEPDPSTLRKALAQGERLSALVADLLDLSRVDSGAETLTLESVDVSDLLETAVDEISLGDRGVEFAVTVVPADLRVVADRARLHQLVANLIDNAARHSPAAGTVTLTAQSSGETWTLEIADEGPGVAPADRERVFERFGTLAETEGGGGTGLGLAIARWVTDLHGGTIAFADRDPGVSGALVRVTVPTTVTQGARPIQEEENMTQNEPTEQQPVVTLPPQPAPPSPLMPPQQVPQQMHVVPMTMSDSLFGGLWPEQGVAGRPLLLAWAVLVGLLAGVALPFNYLGLGTFLVLMSAGSLMLFASKRRKEPFTIASAVLCTALAATALVRDAEWIVVLCLLAGGLLAVVALTNARRVWGFAAAAAAWPFAGLRGLGWLGRTVREVSPADSGLAVARTFLWSLLGLFVFGMLFASADALFAEWFGSLIPDLGSARFVFRSFVAFAVGGIALAGAYLALNPPQVESSAQVATASIRRFEWLAPVLVVNVVFVAFLVSQAAAILGSREYFEKTTGLTYAEYAHEGFGQLTFAAVLTLFVVWAATRKASRETAADRLWLRLSLGALLVMTLAVLGSAFSRMGLYQEAYGFTSLRLLVDVFMAWLGLVVLATMVAGVVTWRGWLPRFGLISGVVLLLGLAAINPEAWVANHNLDRYEETGKVDWIFLAELSDDAVPTIVERIGDESSCALTAERPRSSRWLEWNLGRSRAEGLGVTTIGYEIDESTCPGAK